MKHHLTYWGGASLFFVEKLVEKWKTMMIIWAIVP